jgi:hypothetical protein
MLGIAGLDACSWRHEAVGQDCWHFYLNLIFLYRMDLEAFDLSAVTAETSL